MVVLFSHAGTSHRCGQHGQCCCCRHRHRSALRLRRPLEVQTMLPILAFRSAHAPLAQQLHLKVEGGVLHQERAEGRHGRIDGAKGWLIRKVGSGKSR